ncbi:MAG: urease accessory protein UreF [Gallionellaceae bacterium]
MTQMSLTALPRLLQLSSPMLPVGAFSYSQGLEYAIEARFVHDAASALAWIDDVLCSGVSRFEAPMVARMHTAWQQQDIAQALASNAFFISSRETAELRAETLQMGFSLVRLLEQLDELPQAQVAILRAQQEVSFPCAFALAAAAWNIPPDAAINAYLWSWLENQVSAALKSVPLGQVAGQRILATLGRKLPALSETASGLDDDALSNFSPMLAIVSSRHETQYSRLFRS